MSHGSFVVLTHQFLDANGAPNSKCSEHADLMLEIIDASSCEENLLATWRIAPIPNSFLAARDTFIAEELAPHRRDYLEYEGEISGGRGSVTRRIWGNYFGHFDANEKTWTLLLCETARAENSAAENPETTWGFLTNSRNENSRAKMSYIPLDISSPRNEQFPIFLSMSRDEKEKCAPEILAALNFTHILPSLYDLPLDDARWNILRDASQAELPCVLFSDLAPRAIRALLNYAKIDTSRVVIISLKNFAAQELFDSFNSSPFFRHKKNSSENKCTDLSHPTPRSRWYPLIDETACVGCFECVNFCLFGVYEIGERTPRVAKPDACRDGCPACARVCPSAAIIFALHEEPLIAGEFPATTAQELYRAAQSANPAQKPAEQERQMHQQNAEQEKWNAIIDATDKIKL